MAVEIKYDSNQQFQRDAVDSIVELFNGQEMLDQGVAAPGFREEGAFAGFEELVFGNSMSLAAETLRTNLRRVQDREVELDDGTAVPAIAESQRKLLADGELPMHFSVEMETGTGKTYVYVRTIAELHRKYGFRKFVIVVPSVAIREGTRASLDLLRDHIRDLYDGLQYDHYVYDSNALTRVRQFATASHLQIMVINVAAMVGDAESRIIHRPTDGLNGYAPIDFLRACRPVLIMDEPQSLDGEKQLAGIESLDPLFRIGYSATPPDGAHLVYQLTPVDAYTQRLVKRIGVLSITKDADLNEAFVEVTKVTPSKTDVTATATIHKTTRSGTKPTRVTLRKDADLFDLSGGRDLYRGWTVEDIHADVGLVEFGNGRRVSVAGSSSAADDQHQRLMLREAIESHFSKELELTLQHRRKVLAARMKPLTLFFIERVADYAPVDGKLRLWFEEEYERVRADGRFRNLSMPELADVHAGYFAEKKGVAKEARADSKDAADAFERIMRKKQELLSFDEPLRFIFSHSALSEGWDNPNVFTICNLQDGKSTMRKRQQVGRGLRLPVMANGERCHIDDVNLLTVIAKESFATFAATLQKEIEDETGTAFTGRIVNLRDKKPVRLKDKALASDDFRELWERISPKTRYRVRFSTDAVVNEALRRIAAMDLIEPVKFHVTDGAIDIGTKGVGGTATDRRRDVIAESNRKMPDVVGELCRRLPISRATIVRILRKCGRLEDVTVNPAVFIDQVAEAINQALYDQLSRRVVYSETGQHWEADLFRDWHQGETIAPRVVPVNKSVTDHVVCDSEVEERFARFLDGRSDVPLFVKLPGWFKVPTPLGNYNPDWAFIRDVATGRRVYLVRETKGGNDIRRLRFESEGWKIRFGDAHFRALDVDYDFGNEPERLIIPSRTILSDDEVTDLQRLTSHLPVYSLDAAAGYFGSGHDVEREGWTEVTGSISQDMFVSRVLGRSMEPDILDGSYCIFRPIAGGTRQGKTVLAQHSTIADPDTGGSYTVKKYDSDVVVVDGERRGSVTLRPLNPDFDPIVIGSSDDDVQILAELVRVLE